MFEDELTEADGKEVYEILDGFYLELEGNLNSKNLRHPTRMVYARADLDSIKKSVEIVFDGFCFPLTGYVNGILSDLAYVEKYVNTTD